MSVPSPPASLKSPNREILSKGDIIHRVHKSRFSGDNFNPCLGGQTRFAPIQDSHGKCIPSTYAGSTVNAAIYETIFYDVPHSGRFKHVRQSEVTLRAHSKLEVTRDLTLARLRGPDLRKWNISRKQLIETNASHYGATAKWAEALHRDWPDIDGMMWTSRQCDPDTAYLFFGGRVQPSDFNIVQTRSGAAPRKAFLTDVVTAGQIGGIVIVP